MGATVRASLWDAGFPTIALLRTPVPEAGFTTCSTPKTGKGPLPGVIK